MTIDEKLSHFYDITVEEAHEKAAAILDEHKAALEKMAEEHKTLSEENAQTQIKAETASARREINKALSAEQLMKEALHILWQYLLIRYRFLQVAIKAAL